MVKIYLDPGHGGTDPGAQGNGLQEKNLTLDIAKRIRDILLLEYEGVSVRMSRTGDQTVSLARRTNDANAWHTDYYLSIHINAGGGTGFESYIYPNTGSPTSTYQRAIHEEVLREANFSNRGMKTANFHVLRETSMPALLTENGFIDNRNDASRLNTTSFREKLARGHANGIARTFQLKKKNVYTEPPALFKVQIGSFTDVQNANELASEANAKGLKTYVFAEDDLYKVQIGAFSDIANAENTARQARSLGFDAFISKS